MSKRLTWVVELFDKMSGPARRVARTLIDVDKSARRVKTSLDDMEKKEKKVGTTAEEMAKKTKKASGATEDLARKTGRARDALSRLTSGQRHAGDAARSMGSGIGWAAVKLAGWISLARTAFSIARGVGGLATGFLGQGVKAASFKESTMLGLNMMLRDPKQATAFYNEAVHFADISLFETQPVLQWYRMLAPTIGTQGLGTAGGSRVLKVLAGLGDIAAGSANPQETMERLVLQIGQMMSKGRLTGEEMRPLSEAGVNVGKVYERLGKMMGVSGQELLSPKWAGKIPSGLALQAILGFSSDTYGGGVLGGGMGPASQTFKGLMSTLASRPYRLREDLGNTAGFKSLKAALGNLVNVLDPTTPAGARIKKNIEEIFDRVLGGVFKRFEDPAAVETWINGLLAGLEKLMPKIGEFADRMGRLADAAGRLMDILVPPTDASRAHNTLSTRFGAPSFPAAQHARKLIEAGGGKLTPEEQQVFDQAQKTWWGDHGGPALPPPPPRPAGPPTSMNFGKGAIHIEVNGAQNPQAVGDEVEDRLASVLERLAMQQGAS